MNKKTKSLNINSSLNYNKIQSEILEFIKDDKKWSEVTTTTMNEDNDLILGYKSDEGYSNIVIHDDGDIALSIIKFHDESSLKFFYNVNDSYTDGNKKVEISEIISEFYN